MTSDAVWVVGADQGVYRIDPRTNKRVGAREGYRGGRHRRRRRRRLGDRVWGRRRREDRSAHEHDHAEDPRRVSRPQLARCWRPRRLGGGPVRWPRLAYRPRAEPPAHDPARRRRHLGRRRRRRGLGHERARRPRVPHRPEHEQGAHRPAGRPRPRRSPSAGAPPGSASPGRRPPARLCRPRSAARCSPAERPTRAS